jgi:hypothetical protein
MRPNELLRDFSPDYNDQDEALQLQVSVRRSQEGTQALEDRQASPSSQASRRYMLYGDCRQGAG